MPNRAQKIFKPEFRFGLGGVPLGNEFAKHTDKGAHATLEASWALGVRYFNVAPWYGLGLAERRLGHFLHGQRRGDYLLSSKVGKLLKASKDNRHAEMFPLSDSPNDLVIDYTADGVRRSIEDSLQRLGVSHLDIAFVHDLSPDFAWFPEGGWENLRTAALQFSAAASEAVALVVGAGRTADPGGLEFDAVEDPKGLLERTQARTAHREERAYARALTGLHPFAVFCMLDCMILTRHADGLASRLPTAS